MNTNQMINSLYDGLNVVQVSFDRHDVGAKEYTYKTFENFEIGDMCVVDSPTNGLFIVRVVGKDRSLLEADFRIKWVVAKIDSSAHDKRVDDENYAIELLSRKIAERNRLKAIEFVKEVAGETSVLEIAAELNAKAVAVNGAQEEEK